MVRRLRPDKLPALKSMLEARGDSSRACEAQSSNHPLPFFATGAFSGFAARIKYETSIFSSAARIWTAGRRHLCPTKQLVALPRQVHRFSRGASAARGVAGSPGFALATRFGDTKQSLDEACRSALVCN